jgi:hemin uptake protein HemP
LSQSKTGLTVLDENNYRSYVSTPAKLSQPQRRDPPQRVTSETLLGARGELVIVHNGREYRLRLTHSGKLILTA